MAASDIFGKAADLTYSPPDGPCPADSRRPTPTILSSPTQAVPARRTEPIGKVHRERRKPK